MAAAKKKGGALRVTAPLVGVVSENGQPSQLFYGDIVPEGTSQVSIDHLLDIGYASSEDAVAEPESDDSK